MTKKSPNGKEDDTAAAMAIASDVWWPIMDRGNGNVFDGLRGGSTPKPSSEPDRSKVKKQLEF